MGEMARRKRDPCRAIADCPVPGARVAIVRASICTSPPAPVPQVRRHREPWRSRQARPGAKNGPECDQVGIGAAVRLCVSVIRAEELFRTLIGQVFDGIDIVAACIKSVVRNSLGVLVGQEVGHGALRRQ